MRKQDMYPLPTQMYSESKNVIFADCQSYRSSSGKALRRRDAAANEEARRRGCFLPRFLLLPASEDIQLQKLPTCRVRDSAVTALRQAFHKVSAKNVTDKAALMSRGISIF